jgi:hypothetical protein
MEGVYIMETPNPINPSLWTPRLTLVDVPAVPDITWSYTNFETLQNLPADNQELDRYLGLPNSPTDAIEVVLFKFKRAHDHRACNSDSESREGLISDAI